MSIIAYAILEIQEFHVSLNIVPFQHFHIHPDDGSNCLIIGHHDDMRVLSSIKSSNSFCVDACSIIDSGVFKTIYKGK